MNRLSVLSIVSAVLIALCVFGTTVPAAAAGDAEGADRLVLVGDGAAHAAIVVAPDAPDSLRDIAGRLRDHIKQMTGVDLPLVEPRGFKPGDGEPRRVAICVGPSAMANSVANELPIDPFAPGGQDGVVRVLDSAVVVAGNAALDNPGTRYAVRALLRHFCAECYRGDETQRAGGPLYTLIPQAAELSVPKRLDVRVRIAFLARMPGGSVLERCAEAQKVWFEAVSSLTDPHRDENGPKQFKEAPW